VHERDLRLTAAGAALEATLTVPAGRARGGLVPLHPANDPSRRQLLFDHLVETLVPRGFAVLRFDRRPGGDDDVPFAVQADDALAALDVLRAEVGHVPLGLFGWSQGGWAAPVAAARSPEVAFLVLVAAAGVSPAEQMRYGTAEQLRRAGYGDDELAQLAELRAAVESYLRGSSDRAVAQAVVDRYAGESWFELVYLPAELPEGARWTDMDFDPEPVFAEVRCPVLLFYGEADEWTPIEPSVEAWRRASPADVDVVRLAGADHTPTLGGGLDDPIAPEYERALVDWLEQRL
jgi:pimeloyl-ACP methyl ester carboxylesterase